MDSIIQNHLLEVGVVECVKLKNTEWFTKQDPYVCLQYGSTKFKTRTCSGGGTAPVFQEKFNFTLIEGLREITVEVWNHHRLSSDNLIGSGKVLLQDVISRGYDDRCSNIFTQTGRYAGEVKLKMHYSPPNAAAATPQTMPPPAAITPPPPYTNAAAYPPPPVSAYPPYFPPPSPLPHGYPTTNTYPPYINPAPGQYNRMYPASPY